jgi:N-methylhydantoinase A
MSTRRQASSEPDHGYVDTDLWWRADLLAGDVITGPAIIEEFGSTVPLHPGFALRVDALGNLVITKSATATEA